MLVGVVHHGNKHVQKHHQRDDVVSSKHGRSDKLSELVVWLDIGDIQANQAEHRPEQGLQRLKQPAPNRREIQDKRGKASTGK